MSMLIMGIDGGGSKSHLALFGENGGCAGTAARGILNHEGMEGSFAELEDVLSEFILGALKNAGADAGDVAYAVLGLAGVDTAAQHRTISAILRRIGISRFLLCNDAFLGVAAGCAGGIGISCVNGTGTSLAGVDYGGNTLQVAGVGDLTDDRGGGGWYGRRALGAVYNSLYKCGKQTALGGMLFSLLGVTRKEDYLETLAAALGGGSLTYGAVGRLVFEAAGAGDAAAADILEQSAEHFAGGIEYIAKNMDFPEERPLDISFAGSVFVKEKVKILPEIIERRVRASLGARRIAFRALDTVPVAGAVLWASQRAGFGIEMAGIKETLSKSGL